MVVLAQSPQRGLLSVVSFNLVWSPWRGRIPMGRLRASLGSLWRPLGETLGSLGEPLGEPWGPISPFERLGERSKGRTELPIGLSGGWSEIAQGIRI